jgi:hypothetical protein
VLLLLLLLLLLLPALHKTPGYADTLRNCSGSRCHYP